MTLSSFASTTVTTTALAWLISILSGSAVPASFTFTGAVITTCPLCSTVTVPSVSTGTFCTTASPVVPVVCVALYSFPSASTIFTVAPDTPVRFFVTLIVTSLSGFNSIVLGFATPLSSTSSVTVLSA